jgi:hypothetical protein
VWLRTTPITAVITLALFVPAKADDPCGGQARLLATLNRPTVGFSACAVYPGTAVFEIGYQNQASDAQRQAQYPQNFLRLGLRPRFELDVIGPNELNQRRISGAADSGLGFKYELPPRGRFTIGIDGLYTGPNGNAAFSAGNASLAGNLDVSYNLDPTTAIGTTIALSSTGGYDATGNHGRYGVTTPSFLITKQLRGNYQLYAEYVYPSKLAPDIGGRAFVDYGVQKLLNRKFEIDAELGHSITADRALAFSYIGVGVGIQLGTSP